MVWPGHLAQARKRKAFVDFKSKGWRKAMPAVLRVIATIVPWKKLRFTSSMKLLHSPWKCRHLIFEVYLFLRRAYTLSTF